MSEKITANDLVDRLRVRYDAKEWLTATEVANATGSMAGRWIDFAAIHKWPSRRLYVAVEIKVSRADFRRELEEPEKRRWVEDQMSEFWFAAPKGVIPLEELPEGAGLLETWGDKLRATRRARQRKNVEPKREFMLAMMRRIATGGEKARKELAQTVEPFATLAGRPVSIADLRRLAAKHATLPSEQHRREHAAWLEGHKDAMKGRGTGSRAAERLAAFNEVRRASCELLGRPHWHRDQDAAEDVRTILDAMAEARRLLKEADRLEEIGGKFLALATAVRSSSVDDARVESAGESEETVA